MMALVSHHSAKWFELGLRGIHLQVWNPWHQRKRVAGGVDVADGGLPFASRRSWRKVSFLFSIGLLMVLALLVLIGIFFSSYTTPPQRYGQLGQLIAKTSQGNPRNEKIFIAAAINDQNGDLVKGFWGSNLVSLIGILRPENCFVSLYVNGRPEAHQAWNTLADTLD